MSFGAVFVTTTSGQLRSVEMATDAFAVERVAPWSPSTVAVSASVASPLVGLATRTVLKKWNVVVWLTEPEVHSTGRVV